MTPLHARATMYLENFLNSKRKLKRKRSGYLGFAETFKALSDPVRRDILQLLKQGRMSAGDIAGRYDMTGATISYHLKILKQADLIWEEKEKNFIYYELNTSVLEEIMLWITELKGDGKNDKEES